MLHTFTLTACTGFFLRRTMNMCMNQSNHQLSVSDGADMMGSSVSLVVGGVDVVPGMTSDLNPVLKV